MIKNSTSDDICIGDIYINILTMAHLFIHPGLNVPCSTGSLIKSPEELLQNIVNAGSDVYQFAGLVYEVLFNSFT